MKSTRHAKYNINYHFVWIPKYRKQILYKEVKDKLKAIFYEIAKQKEIEILNLEIQIDHIHMFLSSPPKNSPSLIINWFKGISARVYNHKYNKKLRWTRSYYVGTAGKVTAETIRRYIDEQTKKNN